MNILKFLYKSGSLERKIIDIKDDINKLISPICKEDYWIDHYGAYKLNPNNLVFWICVQSDKLKSELKSNENLIIDIKKIFYKHKYPIKSSDSINVGFESQQTVDRESEGNWYVHFK